MPTVALDVPSAHVLADQASIIQDLQFVMDCCKRLLAELAKPEEERDAVMPLALWSSAVLAYGRCFGKGKRFGLTAEDVRNLPLHGAVMKFHKWVIEERDRPAALNATVSANTINGAITSDFPLTTSGKLVAHHAKGVVGDGGRQVELNAVNGSVRLKKLAPPTRH